MQFVKAQLIPKDAGVKSIEFMFNPTELSFSKYVGTFENTAALTQEDGQPKVSFSNISSYTVTINKILFDTYETGENVVEKYIEQFRKAVQFPEDGGDKQRTPLYTFSWGKNVYLRYCFVEKLSYKLTLFLPDGTPVRAVIDSLTLKEADEPKPNQDQSAPSPSNSQRQQDSPENRRKI